MLLFVSYLLHRLLGSFNLSICRMTGHPPNWPTSWPTTQPPDYQSNQSNDQLIDQPTNQPTDILIYQSTNKQENDHLSFLVPDTCVIRWNNATYTSSVGAMLQSSITTLDACLNGCISQPTCVAVDYNFRTSPQQCWFHDDMAKVNVKRTDSQTNQYVLDRCFQCK